MDIKTGRSLRQNVEWSSSRNVNSAGPGRGDSESRNSDNELFRSARENLHISLYPRVDNFRLSVS